jgi:hypothetical protein
VLGHVHVDVGLDVFIVYYFRAVGERKSARARARARGSERGRKESERGYVFGGRDGGRRGYRERKERKTGTPEDWRLRAREVKSKGGREARRAARRKTIVCC